MSSIMRTISITVTDNNELYFISSVTDLADGISLDFFINIFTTSSKQVHLILKSLESNVTWFKVENDKYFFDLREIKEGFPDLFDDGCYWMTGTVEIKPEIGEVFEELNKKIVVFSMTKEELLNKMSNRIFLSHKGANKDKVREYYTLLCDLGFEPWLDEVDMPAGEDPYRGILQGFKESCAVVFFITPEFKDEKFLKNEVTYAVKEYTNKDDYRIITLQFKDPETGKMGVIPELLETYIWKKPQTDMEGLKEILKALPIKVGTPVWKK